MWGAENDMDDTLTCPICKTFQAEDIATLTTHANSCIDSLGGRDTADGELDEKQCQICKKDISKYTAAQKMQHINRCCDKSSSRSKTEPSADTSDFVPAALTNERACPTCKKIFKSKKVILAQELNWLDFESMYFSSTCIYLLYGPFYAISHLPQFSPSWFVCKSMVSDPGKITSNGSNASGIHDIRKMILSENLQTAGGAKSCKMARMIFMAIFHHLLVGKTPSCFYSIIYFFPMFCRVSPCLWIPVLDLMPLWIEWATFAQNVLSGPAIRACFCMQRSVQKGIGG